MRQPESVTRAWRCMLFLLLSTLLLRVPLSAAGEPSLPRPPLITSDVRSRLAEAAQNAKLEPWQRDFMLGVARGNVESGATAPTSALPGPALPSAATAADDGAWTRFPPPSALMGHTAIYDPVRDRMVVFGGLDIKASNDVWALSLAGIPAWSSLAPTGIPPVGRYAPTAIYDPVRDRMIVFGGLESNAPYASNGVWALSLAGNPAWSQITPTGTPPLARYLHTAIYDPVRDRMMVYGGLGLPDVWALSLAGSPAWNELVPAGTPPSAHAGHTALYDPVRDRMVVFGGVDSFNGQSNEVSALSLAGSPAWSALVPAGTPPVGRSNHTAIYDPVRDRMVVFGGSDGSGYRNDVWALSLAGSPAWSALAPAGTPPAGREGHSAIYDPVRDRMVAFGGENNSNATQGDVWALALAASPAWSALTPAGSPPAGRESHSVIRDPVRDRMVVFGGEIETSGLTNEVWAFSLAGSPGWTALAPAGIPPSARFFHTAIYDPVRDRMIVFGGYDGSVRNDVWALSLAGSPAWSALAPAGTPPSARLGHTAIYDPVRDRMVVFAGFNGSVRNNEVWALSLAGSPAWSALATAGTPPSPRHAPTAIYDPVRDRMLVFGGSDGSDRNDVWALSLAGSPAWQSLAPAGTPPTGRDQHTAIHDPVRDRMVVFGGYDGSYQDDAWALSLGASPAWTSLAPAASPPSGRIGHAAIYDPVRDRMLITFGGLGGNSYRNDVWALGWAPPVSVPGSALLRRFEFAPPRPNPSRGEATTLDFELGEPGRVVLDVFDAHGRRVRRIADGWYSAGRHASAWRGDDDRGHALGSGVYFIRMRVGGGETTRRTVRVR